MQQRQRVRERTPEREQRVQDYEWNESRDRDRNAWNELYKQRPRVVKFDTVPWEQSRAAHHKVFTGPDVPLLTRKPWLAPMNTLRLLMQEIEGGHKNSNHRHYAEVPFFIVEGKGHEVHDAKRYDWEAGDLMIVPPYTMHQHFCDEGPARLIYCQAAHGGVQGGEVAELNEYFKLPENARFFYDDNGTVVGYKRENGEEFMFGAANALGREEMARRFSDSPPVPSHQVTDDYEYFLRLYQEECYWRQMVPQVIKQKDRHWQDTRNGRVLWFLHPNHPPLTNGMRLFECYLQELPPGGRSGKHHHIGEEVHFILEGRGYDVINDVKWEWEANDVVATPILSTHQSFNSDPAHPAKFVVFKSRTFDYASFGGIEHFEDASG